MLSRSLTYPIPITALSAVRNMLNFSVFFLEPPLHLKLGLPFAFDALLLLVPQNACVHCLRTERVNSRLIN